jgi:hypothetical protein
MSPVTRFEGNATWPQDPQSSDDVAWFVRQPPRAYSHTAKTGQSTVIQLFAGGASHRNTTYPSLPWLLFPIFPYPERWLANKMEI